MDTCPHNPTGCWFLGIISCELQVRTDELMFVLSEQPHQVRYQVRYTSCSAAWEGGVRSLKTPVAVQLSTE